MSRSLARTAAAVAGTTLAVTSAFAATAVAAPTGDGAVPTFQEFAASTFQDLDGGYVVNGDEPATSTGALRQFYDAMVAEPDTLEEGLIVNTVNGVDAKWSATQTLNLTYCVSTSFGTNYTARRQRHGRGRGAVGGGAANVNFVYVPRRTRAAPRATPTWCSTWSPVKPGSTSRAPSSPARRSRRNVLIDTTASAPPALDAERILRHELGHTLGFRHEHTRPEAGTCFEDNNWRALTSYDSLRSCTTRSATARPTTSA